MALGLQLLGIPSLEDRTQKLYTSDDSGCWAAEDAVGIEGPEPSLPQRRKQRRHRMVVQSAGRGDILFKIPATADHENVVRVGFENCAPLESPGISTRNSKDVGATSHPHLLRHPMARTPGGIRPLQHEY